MDIRGWQNCERCGEVDAPQGELPFCCDCLDLFFEECFGKPGEDDLERVA